MIDNLLFKLFLIIRMSVQCSVCLEKITDDAFKSKCGHCFHNKCITNWLLTKSSCPVCRYSLCNVEEEEFFEEDDDFNLYLDTKQISIDGFEEAIAHHALDCIENSKTIWEKFYNMHFLETCIQKRRGNLIYRINMVIKNVQPQQIFIAEFLNIEVLTTAVEIRNYKNNFNKNKFNKNKNNIMTRDFNYFRKRPKVYI